MEEISKELRSAPPQGVSDQHDTEPGVGVRRQANLTPSERSLRSRIAAYKLHATHDPHETTKPARNAFLARFEREVDPDGRLPEAERRRRAEAGKKAYFSRLALKSARARRSRRQQ
ncbi:MAG: hypothetical protein M3450_01445 [Actinomycetota bacterium]|nr:hypothetical protein [Actinomycetota bacterium]MDQ3640147.1 hypothetical protein [Actinomycetota bacterium]